MPIEIIDNLVGIIMMLSPSEREYIFDKVKDIEEHRDERSKELIKAMDKQIASKRAMYAKLNEGYTWFTNGKENRKMVENYDFIPKGWYKGFTINKEK